MSEKVSLVTPKDRKMATQRLLSFLPKGKVHDCMVFSCEENRIFRFCLRNRYFDSDDMQLLVESVNECLCPQNGIDFGEDESVVMICTELKIRFEHRFNKKDYFSVEYRIHKET